MAKICLAVHGGAWNIPDALWPAHKDGCERAWQAGMKVLEAGGPALDAVAAAIRIMEDDPTYDAGYGSFLNEDGDVELDAGLMEGASLESGAAIGVSQVKNPIDLALHILRESSHCIFAGEGAHRLAEKAGFDMVASEIHVHPRERDLLNRIKNGDASIEATAWTDQPHDTVGAVAIDANGVLVAGNSTGGVINKAVGRVGDAPLMGLGFYADNQLGAFVCTGWGESIMRSGMGMHGLHLMRDLGPQRAAEEAVAHLEKRVSGFGGLILMAPDGEMGVAHNTQRMAWLTENKSAFE